MSFKALSMLVVAATAIQAAAVAARDPPWPAAFAPPAVDGPYEGRRWLERGRSAYESGQYAQAFTAFSHAADCGEAEAARLALQMRQHGPRLFQQNFFASPAQVMHWRALRTGEAGQASALCAASPDPDDADAHWRHQGVG